MLTITNNRGGKMKLLPFDKRNSKCSCCGKPFAKYEFDGKLFCNRCILFAVNDSTKEEKECIK